MFEVVPASPAITNDNIIAFKGNFQVVGVGKTGVFFHQLMPNAECMAEPTTSSLWPAWTLRSHTLMARAPGA
jgi:hypothetical protein